MNFAPTMPPAPVVVASCIRRDGKAEHLVVDDQFRPVRLQDRGDVMRV